MSPFWSDDPDITLSNVTQAVWQIPEELFQGVSEDAKDFLTKLLVKDTRLAFSPCVSKIVKKMSCCGNFSCSSFLFFKFRFQIKILAKG